MSSFQQSIKYSSVYLHDFLLKNRRHLSSAHSTPNINHFTMFINIVHKNLHSNPFVIFPLQKSLNRLNTVNCVHFAKSREKSIGTRIILEYIYIRVGDELEWMRGQQRKRSDNEWKFHFISTKYLPFGRLLEILDTKDWCVPLLVVEI